MICSNCGTQVRDGVQFCPNCGAKQAVEGADAAPRPEASQVTPYAQQAQAYGTAGQKQPEDSARGLGIGGMVCGIIGLVCCFVPGLSFIGLIVAIVGLVLSVMSRKRGGGGMATAGLVCSIIALVIWVIAILLVGALCATVGAGTLAALS